MKSSLLFALLIGTANVLITQPIRAEDKAMDEKITKLQIIDHAVGNGQEAVSGKMVEVDYTGWLYDPKAPDKKGKKFDSSLDRGQPIAFPLGSGRVIKGWDEGIKGMKEDGKRTLIIPPDMAYGNRGAGGAIPPGATLLFDVELISVK
jgi:FKBP-type peptidyl-prolyl cis-trans isomerase FkpA